MAESHGIGEMGRRWYDNDPEWYWRWSSPGKGRFWKRRLAKALRRVARAECDGRRQRIPGQAVSEVSYKGW